MTPQDPRSEGAVEADNAGIDPATAADAGPDELLRKVETEAAELKDAWLRARAEAENARRQSREDVARATKFAIEKFAQDLLPVKDALEQALASQNLTVETLRSGAELTLKTLQSAFARANVQEVDPTGQKFDPHQHQAIALVDGDQPANTVVNVLQKGYVLNDRVLRPALVTVTKGAAQD